MGVTSALLLAGLVVAGPASAADTQPPTEPGTITVSAVTASTAQLKWGGSTDDTGIEGYRVYRGPASAPDSSLSLIETTDAINSFPSTNLRSSYAYKFGVTAIDSADNQSPMRTTTLTTLASSDTTPPAAPSNSSVSLSVFSSSRIDVIYGASTSDDVAYYLIYRGSTLVGTVEKPYANHYSDNGLSPSTSYSYTVVAVDSAGNRSTPTAVKSATTLAVGVPKIARGPYLGNMTGTSCVVSWYTNIATPGVVTIAGQQVTDPAGTVQHHTVTITGLTPGTSYPYTVTSGTASGSGTVRTAANPGSTFSFAAIGDFGGGSPGETENATNVGSSGTQFIQTLGDDIYPSAGLPDPNFTTTYSDFDGRFFKPFGAVVKSQAFFPANGNKEYYGDGEFWQTFPMPGTNHSWYSYDWGDAHILVLDSEVPFAVGTPQYQFAQADLAAHQSAAWRIVALQRPPYSSTTELQLEAGPAVSGAAVPAENVNLVLSGNSHNYERSYPLANGRPATGWYHLHGLRGWWQRLQRVHRHRAGLQRLPRVLLLRVRQGHRSPDRDRPWTPSAPTPTRSSTPRRSPKRARTRCRHPCPAASPRRPEVLPVRSM